jgi:hypothetical protein
MPHASRKTPSPLPRLSALIPDRSVWPVRYQYETQKAPYEQNAVDPNVLP